MAFASAQTTRCRPATAPDKVDPQQQRRPEALLAGGAGSGCQNLSMSEQQRLQAVRDLALLDTAAEERFDRFTRVLARSLDCPVATLSLVDRNRVWYKSVYGVQLQEMPRANTFCTYVLDAGGFLMVEDAGIDAHFYSHALVSGPVGLRFMAGVPLYDSAGMAVGCLSVYDRSSRSLAESQIQTLWDLAALAEQELARRELEYVQRRLEASEQRYRALIESNPDAVFTADRAGRILDCNEALLRLSGCTREQVIGEFFGPMIAPEDRARVHNRLQLCLGGEPQHVEVRALRADGSDYYASISGAPYVVDGEVRGIIGVSRDVTARVQAEQRLRRSEQRLTLALETSRQGVWEWDVASGSTYQSPQLRMLVGGPSEEVEGHIQDWWARLHPDDFPQLRTQTRGLLQGEDVIEGEFRLRCNDDVYRWFRYHGRVVSRGPKGEPIRVVGVTGDVHERKQAERERQRVAERMALALQAGKIGVFEMDPVRGIVSRDARMAELYGMAEDAPLPTIAELQQSMHPDDRERFVRTVSGMFERLDTEPVDIEYRIVRPDGQIRHLRFLSKIVTDFGDSGPIMVGICHDVTEELRLKDELSYQATHDALTGLYNRFEFERRLEAALAAGGEHALCYIDLDRFKIINDTAGHAAGDALLRELSEALTHSLRKDDVLARLGGDEFGLLLRNCDVEVAERLCEELIECIAAHGIEWQGRSYEVSASIGIARLGPGIGDAAEAMTEADVACYVAKASGRARAVVYRAEHSAAQQHHHELKVAASIREALVSDRFCLYAQAIVPVAETASEPLHYELLLRMYDEGGAIVSPALFIPAAEHYDLMARIDRWVLCEALEHQGERIREAGVTVAINLSAQSLNDPTFVPFVRDLVKASPIPAQRIHFEITETAAVTHMAAAGKVVQALRELGCAVALDDFGSGLSSFTYLKHFPVDYVKIDGSFVRAIEASDPDRLIVDSIHTLAHNFGARTIAEYVENPAILERLRAIGVDYAQGYGIGRPQPLKHIL